MPVPLEDHVRQILLERDRGSKFHAAVATGWRSAIQKNPDRNWWRRKTTFRSVVWEEVTNELASVAAGDDNLEWLPHQDTVSIIAENEVLFRLKHADVALTTSNFPTAEATAFDDHDKDLYGYKGLQRVRLCYVPDRFENSLIWQGIAAHYNGVFLWNIELSEAGALAPIERLPLQEPKLDVSRIAKLRQDRNSGTEDKKDAG